MKKTKKRRIEWEKKGREVEGTGKGCRGAGGNVRQHSETIRLEGHVWPLFQIPLFLIILLGLYVDFTLNWTSGILIAISMVLGMASYLVRFGFFLQPKPVIFVQKVRERVVRYGKVASAAFVTTSASFVIVAFIMGSLRADLLQTFQDRILTTETRILRCRPLVCLLLQFLEMHCKFRVVELQCR